MKIPRFFYDPDNPYSRFVWGVEPGHERMRKKTRREFQVLLALTGAPLLIGIGSGITFEILVNSFEPVSIENWIPTITLGALGGLGWGWTFLSIAVLFMLIGTNAAGIIRSTDWRDMRLAGLPGRQTLTGCIGRTACAVTLAVLVQTGFTLLLIIILGSAAAIGRDGFGPGGHVREVFEFALTGLGMTSALAFLILSTMLLDFGLWARHPGLLPRMASWTGLMLCSPIAIGFICLKLFGRLPFGLPGPLLALLEFPSWSVRGWIVWRVWRSAIRTLDEDDVP